MIRARWKGHLLELHNAARRWESVSKHAPNPTPGLLCGRAERIRKELEKPSWVEKKARAWLHGAKGLQKEALHTGIPFPAHNYSAFHAMLLATSLHPKLI